MATKKKKAAKKRPISRKASKKAIKKRPVIKKLKKRPILKKKPTAPKRKKAEPGLIGVMTHYFPHVRAAVVKMQAPLTVGDIIKIKGHTTDLKQAVSSLQIDRLPIQSVKKGQEIGLMVESRVRRKDKVYKV